MKYFDARRGKEDDVARGVFMPRDVSSTSRGRLDRAPTIQPSVWGGRGVPRPRNLFSLSRLSLSPVSRTGLDPSVRSVAEVARL